MAERRSGAGGGKHRGNRGKDEVLAAGSPGGFFPALDPSAHSRDRARPDGLRLRSSELLPVLLGGVSAHAGINLISDFNDFRKGVDTTDALSTHPGALVYELVRPESILAAAMLMFLVASQAGAFLLVRAGPAVIVFEGVGFLGGYFYTGGFLAYKYRGLGELFIALLMGPLMVLGAYVVQTGRMDALPVLLSLALGSLVASVTLANNLRDVHDDRTAGISTLPMRIGVRSAKRLYYAMLAVPYAIVAGVVVLRLAHWPMLLVLLSLPSAAKAIRKILRR